MRKKTARAVVVKVNKRIVDIVSNWAEIEKLLFSPDDRPLVSHRYEAETGEYLEITPSKSGWVTPQDQQVLKLAVEGLVDEAGNLAENRPASVCSLVASWSPSEIEASFWRLKDLEINASIITGEYTVHKGFALITSMNMSSEDGVVLTAEVKLSDWCLNTILGNPMSTAIEN